MGLGRNATSRFFGGGAGLVAALCALLSGLPLSSAAGPAERPFAPSRGQNHVLVLLVNYSDTTPTYTPAQFEDLFFGQHESTFRDYFQKASYGQLDHVGTVVGWLRVSRNHDYYANNEYGQKGTSYPTNAYQLVMEAVDLAEAAGVNFRLYDNPLDGATDGVVDTLIVVHQGRGGEVINNPKNIWSFTGALSDGSAYARTYDGVVIDQFAIVPEVSYRNDRIIEVGPVAHEYGHLLGLVDLYDRDGGSAGMGLWEFMSNGVWGGDLNSPQYPVFPSAYTRVELGWVNPVTVSGSTQGWFALPAAARAPGVLKIPANRSTDREFFLAEYKPKTGYDRNIPAGGVAVYHVDYRNLFENRDTFIGCGNLVPRVALEQADGRYDLERLLSYGDTADLYPRPGGGASAFHAATVPDTRNHDCRLSGFALSGFSFAGDTAWVYARSDDFRPSSASPQLLADQLAWVEVAGDGDHDLETGEIFRPVLTVANTGATALGLTASFLSDSPFLLIGGTEMFFSDVAPGETATAAGGPYMTVLPGYNPEVAEPLTVHFAYAGGSQDVSAQAWLGAPDLLYVDDDGGEFTERHLGPYLIDMGLSYNRWDVARSGPPTAADLAGYPTVFWVTGLTDQPLDAAELSALSAYLDGGGTLFLSSAYLLIKPTAGAAGFAHAYLHLNTWTDDRYAVNALRGINNNPISHVMWVGPANYYYPLLDRTSGLTPDSLAAGAILNDRSHYTTVVYPSSPSTPTVFRTVFDSFGIENIHRDNLGQFLRRTFNVFRFRPGRPWAILMTTERAQPRKVNLATQINGFGFAATNGFSFSGFGVTIASATWLNIYNVNLILRVAWDADPGWHDLIITMANGDTARVPHLFKVEGQPLPNHAPDANAGPDQNAYRNTVITLNGSQSSDADYDPLTYRWTQTAGPAVTLSPSDSAPTVTFNSGGLVGAYKFDLTVSDPFLSDADSVVINILNRAPTARAGADQAGYRANTFTLDARASTDPDGDALTAHWVQTAGPALTILPTDTAMLATFVPNPNWVGAYRFRLDISDPWTLASDTITVTVANRLPVANAGPGQRVAAGTWVTLDGSLSSDQDGDALTFQWTQDAGPVVTLDLLDPVRPRVYVITPDIYHFNLRCADPFGLSPADGVTVMINLPPVAEAGPGTGGFRGDQITLDGSLSSDPNGDPITYLWQQLSGPPVSLSAGATAAMTGFTAPRQYQGDYVFRLTVSDSALTDSDTVTVSIRNHPPVAMAGPDKAGLRSQVFLLDGDSSHDPDGDTLGYQWLQLAGPPATLLPSDTVAAVFFTPAPDGVGRYVFKLQASDPWDTAGDTVAVSVINLPPTARAGADVLTILGDTVTLDGDSSADPDGDPLLYQWQQLSGPAVTLDPANPARPVFPAAAIGNYMFQLVVDDSFDVSDADTVGVVILSRWNHRPVANAGPDQTLDWVDFTPVQLDGSQSSDADNDPLVYQWTMSSKPGLSSAVLSNPASPTPTFNHDYVGTYVLRLSVFDGEIWSAPDEMTVVTAGNTIDTDLDGTPDCLDPDDDNDTLPDTWESAHGLNPLSAQDGDPGAQNDLTDPDHDGNTNLNEYYNGSDPQVADRVECTARIGGCYFGDSDGDFFYTPVDFAAYRTLVKGIVTQFPNSYPHNGDNFDLDGDSFITPVDLSLLQGMIKGVGGLAAGIPAEAVMVAPGYTVSASAGATVGLTFRVVSSAGMPRSGLAVIFQLFSGAGKFLGGEGVPENVPTLVDLSEFNTPANESAFAMSRDELEIFVASDRSGGMGGFDLYSARRASPNDSFGPMTNVGELNTGYYETTPAISADRREIFFARYVTSWDIYHATRPDVNSAWLPPEPVAELDTAGLESAPSITDDGLTIYFVRWVSTNLGHQIYRAHRATTSSPFETPTPVDELNSSATDNLPSISGDDTRIYFMSNRNAGPTDYNLWYAERANPSLPFSAPVPLNLVNTNLGDLQAWESPDRLRLYISTYGYHATGDVNMYMVWRPSPNLPYWTGNGPARYDVTGTIAETAAQDSGGRAHMVFAPQGCGTFDIAAYGSQDVLQKVPTFSAARLVRVTVPCP